MNNPKIKITRIQANYPNDRGLVAICNVVLADALIIRNVRIIRLHDGRYIVDMPSRQNNLGEWRSMVHPIEDGFRRYLWGEILSFVRGGLKGDLNAQLGESASYPATSEDSQDSYGGEMIKKSGNSDTIFSASFESGEPPGKEQKESI